MIWLVFYFAAGYTVMGCSQEYVQYRLNKCQTMSLNNLTAIPGHDSLLSFCKNLECNIKCYIDALGDCYEEDEFVSYNPDTFTVTSRALCSNINDTLLGLTQCTLKSSCLQTFTNANENTLDLYNAGYYAAYKIAFCDALVQYVSCVEFSTSPTCTSRLANIAEDFYKASLSYKTCGIEEHPYFSTYSGDVICNGIDMQRSHFLIMLVISCISVIIVNQLYSSN